MGTLIFAFGVLLVLINVIWMNRSRGSTRSIPEDRQLDSDEIGRLTPELVTVGSHGPSDTST